MNTSENLVLEWMRKGENDPEREEAEEAVIMASDIYEAVLLLLKSEAKP